MPLEPFASSKGSAHLTPKMRDQRLVSRLIWIIDVGEKSKLFANTVSRRFQHLEETLDVALDLDHAELEDVVLHARNNNVTGRSHKEFRANQLTCDRAILRRMSIAVLIS